MKDSLGNELTKEQEIFFKDSKIRDEKGNLLVLHHGSPIKNIKIFKEDDDYGNFFTTNLNYAKEYAKDQETEIIGTIYDVYLNIKNPLHINSEEAKEIYKDKAKTLTQATDIVYNHIRQNRQLGYDGIIASEELSDDNKRKYGEDADISYIPLDANQVKMITNKTPTNSKDINEGLNNMYKKIKTKKVKDSYGFVDDYTMYEDDAGNYIFILGDPDFETPDNTKPDHEIKAGNEAKKLAYDWWKNYGTPKATVDSSDEDDREAEKHKKSLDLAKRIYNDLEDFFKTEDFEDEAYFNEYDREAFGDTYDALDNYLTSEGY